MKLVIKSIHGRLEALVRCIKSEFGELWLLEVAERNDSRKKLVDYNNKRNMTYNGKNTFIKHPENIWYRTIGPCTILHPYYNPNKEYAQ